MFVPGYRDFGVRRGDSGARVRDPRIPGGAGRRRDPGLGSPPTGLLGRLLVTAKRTCTSGALSFRNRAGSRSGPISCVGFYGQVLPARMRHRWFSDTPPLNSSKISQGCPGLDDKASVSTDDQVIRPVELNRLGTLVSTCNRNAPCAVRQGAGMPPRHAGALQVGRNAGGLAYAHDVLHGPGGICGTASSLGCPVAFVLVPRPSLTRHWVIRPVKFRLLLHDGVVKGHQLR